MMAHRDNLDSSEELNSSAVYKFNYPFSQSQNFSGIFVLTKSEYLDILSQPLIYLGDTQDTHAEIMWYPNAKHLTRLTDEAKIVDFMREHASGINPKDHIGL